mgnify:CR=1 FL=1
MHAQHLCIKFYIQPPFPLVWTFAFLTTGKWSSFLNFKVSCYFRIFVVEGFHLVNDYVHLGELSFEFARVVWHNVSCFFFGETIGDTFDQPMVITHFSRGSVCQMLSKRIGLPIVNERTANPKHVKFLFCATINSVHARVIISVYLLHISCLINK